MTQHFMEIIYGRILAEAGENKVTIGEYGAAKHLIAWRASHSSSVQNRCS
jgi:hypothetical protein